MCDCDIVNDCVVNDSDCERSSEVDNIITAIVVDGNGGRGGDGLVG